MSRIATLIGWVLASWSLGLHAANDPLFRCDSLAADRLGALTVETRLAGVPALLRIPPRIGAAPIVLWHGFAPPASEQALLEVLPLDEVPAIKVYLGLPLFGQRAPAGGNAELARRQSEDFAGQLFAPAVMGAADELPAVLTELHARACLQQGDAIGLFGFSAGGAAVLYALAEQKVAAGAAVIVNASTGLKASVRAYERATKETFDWTAIARSVAKRSDAVLRHADISVGDPPRRVMIVQGAEDSVLGLEVARHLYAALLPDYRSKAQPERLQLLEIPGLPHSWTAVLHSRQINAAATAWFDGS